MIPDYKTVKQEAEDQRSDYEKRLFREFEGFINQHLPSAGQTSMPCETKFLSISDRIKKEYAKHGWSIDFVCKLAFHEISDCRVLIKGIEKQ